MQPVVQDFGGEIGVPRMGELVDAHILRVLAEPALVLELETIGLAEQLGPGADGEIAEHEQRLGLDRADLRS